MRSSTLDHRRALPHMHEQVEREAALLRVAECCRERHRFTPSESGLLKPESRLEATRTTILQREGELILIPPNVFHQTYHLEPTVAVAGQYMCSDNAPSVLNHILDWCDVSDKERGSLSHVFPVKGVAADDASVQSTINEVISIALKSKHGSENGSALMKQLGLI